MYKLRILKPENHADFEVLCKHVYGTVLNCITPKSYGRSGQKQYGIDVLVQKNDLKTSENRVGIQCKHVEKLTFDGKSGDSICNEVAKADKGVSESKIDISHLIIVTSLPSDVKLIQETETLSDQRQDKGLFTVDIEFWDEIEAHIYENLELRQRYTNLDRFHQRLIDSAGRDFENGRYAAVIDVLSEYSEKNEFTYEERVQILKLLSLSYAYLLQRDKAKISIDLAHQLAPNDNNIILAKLHILSLDDEDIDLYKTFMEQLSSSTDDEFLNELEFESAVKFNVIPEFEALSDTLQKKYEVKLRYLIDANQKQNNLQFQKIYNLLLEEEQIRSEVILLRIQDSLQQQNLELASKLVKTHFSPRHKTLWKIEHIVIRDNIILTLLNVYLSNKEYSNALALLEEAEYEENIIDDKLLYAYFDIAIQTKDHDLFQKGKERFLERIEQCSIDTMLGVTQISLKFEDKEVIDIILERVLTHYSQNELDKFKLFIWLEAAADRPEYFIENIKSSSLLTDPDFRVLYGLVIKLGILKDQDESLKELYEQVVLVTNKSLDNLPDNILFLPRVLNYFSATEQYKEAYFLLKEQPQTEYILKEKFPLAIELNLFQEAREYIRGLEWQEIINDEVLLINTLVLAQRALDWNLLEDIIKNKERSGKLNASLWLIKLDRYEKYNRSQFMQVLRNLPEDIGGKDSELFALANLEVKHGFEKKGLRRLFPIVRNNLFNSKINMSYLMLLSTLNPSSIREDNRKVDIGTTVYYENSIGSKFFISIDFEGSFIGHECFISSSDQFSKRILGRHVGDMFYIEKMGMKDEYTITAIESIYITLNKLGHENMQKPNFSKDVRLMAISLDDIENSIVNPLIEMSEKREETNRILFNTYAQFPVSLHFLAASLGIEEKAFALIYEWPENIETPLYSDMFGVNNNLSSSELFVDTINQISININDKSTLVIDSLTFLELEKYSKLNILNLLKKQLIISSHTLDTFYNWRYILQNEVSKFSLGAQNKKLVRYDHNNGFMIDKINSIITFIEDFCDVFPTYGSDDKVLLENYKIMNSLSYEEQSVIRLCHEKKAILFSFDGRLRLWADVVFKVNTISMGDVLNYLVSKHLLDYELAESIFVSQILDNRQSIGYLNFALYVKHMFSTQENFVRILEHLKNHLNSYYDNNEFVKYCWESISLELAKKLGSNLIRDFIKYWLIDEVHDRSEEISLFLFRKNFIKTYRVDASFKVNISKFQFEITDGTKKLTYNLTDIRKSF